MVLRLKDPHARPCETVTFAVTLPKVIGKERPRFSYRRGQGFKTYTPPATEKAERMIAAAFVALAGTTHTRDMRPVALTIAAEQALPKSAAARRKGELWTSKPDADNIAKLVLDALNGVAYHDDGQVVKLTCEKCPRTAPYSGGKLYVDVLYMDA